MTSGEVAGRAGECSGGGGLAGFRLALVAERFGFQTVNLLTSMSDEVYAAGWGGILFA